MKKGAFFDRDGTIIKDISYLDCLEKIEYFPSVLNLMRFLHKDEYLLFVITNQSGVARGFFDEDFVKKTHETMHTYLMNHGIMISAWYYCPHHPTEGICKQYVKECFCRKPKAGMIFKAAAEWSLDLSKSLLFGDQKSDIDAGKSAGCKSIYITDLDCDSIVQNKILNL